MTTSAFISVDWGTTRLRIRYVALPSLMVLEEISGDVGIKYVYHQWLESGGDRSAFFLSTLIKECLKLKLYSDDSLPILISGMASSRLGICELDYAVSPLATDGSNFVVKKINSPVFKNPVFLISGVRKDMEVMRGEETQFLGIAESALNQNKTVVILPGTHSKHIFCSNGVLTDIKTYMTGELFEAIVSSTILQHSVIKDEINAAYLEAFGRGVHLAKSGESLSNTLFRVRTNDLFSQSSKSENYYFLSGLIIGEELKTFLQYDNYKVLLAAGGHLAILYKKAFEILGMDENVQFLEKNDVDLLVIRGQYRILNHILKNPDKYV